MSKRNRNVTKKIYIKLIFQKIDLTFLAYWESVKLFALHCFLERIILY